MNNYKYQNYVETVIASHNNYYYVRNIKNQLYVSLDKANELEKILSKKVEEELDENSYENKCSICLQTMKNKNKIQTSCNHTFCFDCIEYNRKHNKHTGDQCSICRNKIFD
jgi:hypothetical protein